MRMDMKLIGDFRFFWNTPKTREKNAIFFWVQSKQFSQQAACIMVIDVCKPQVCVRI
jgi:hypothetical protein